MKRIVILVTALVLSAVTFAQTPQEIIANMEAEMEKYPGDAVIMTMDLKMPILGTMSTRTWTVGNKIRLEGEAKGTKVITWIDDITQWTYNSKDNQIVIEKHQPSKDEGGQDDLKLFTGITEGYDVTITKETEDAWYMLCKKSKTNKDKDAPKKMDLVVAKGTYMPISISAKLSGVGMTIRDISFDVTEKDVTFDPDAYPGVQIVDKR